MQTVLFLILREGILLRNFIGLFTAFITKFTTLVEDALGSLALLLRQSHETARTRIRLQFSILRRNLMQIYGGDGLWQGSLSSHDFLLKHHLYIIFESLKSDEDYRNVVK